jgi:hypothetical protein
MAEHHVYESALLHDKKEVAAYLFDMRFDDVVGISKYLRDDLPAEKPIRKKLFSIGVELLENLHRHTVKSPEFSPDQQVNTSKAFLIQHDQACWYLTAGNLILAKNSLALKNRLDAVNDATAEQLREMYLKRIEVAELSDNGGAGLGLMDIGLKSVKRLRFEIIPLDDKHDYWVLQVPSALV